MNNKTKNIIVTISFLIIVIGGFLLNCIVKDETVSLSERRKLKQFPKITFSNIINGKFSDEFEKYAMDQFVERDYFRAIKAFTHFFILGQKDNNGLFIKDGSIYKQTGALNENEIKKATDKFNEIQNKYLANNKAYFAIVPDKNYFLKDNELRMDYEKLENIMKDNLINMQYIDLFSNLSEKDYYKTDTHWKQENLLDVAKLIAKSMGREITLEDVQINTKGDFYGVYAGQLNLGGEMHDELKYVTTSAIENSTTFNIETNKENTVYDEEKWKKSSDKYDYFVSGATPCITITNSLAKEDKELIIFRDSFASSLTPLLLEGYSKITLVDIRYMSSSILEDYIDFKSKDVLFLYSTLVLNEASILK